MIVKICQGLIFAHKSVQKIKARWVAFASNYYEYREI